MAQFYRDIQIGTVWEGSGNVIALDVLRAMAKEPESVDAFLAECELARGSDQRFDAHLDATRAGLEDAAQRRSAVRRPGVVEDMALALQASAAPAHRAGVRGRRFLRRASWRRGTARSGRCRRASTQPRFVERALAD